MCLQVDSLSAIQLLTGNVATTHPAWPLVERAHALLRLDWEVKVEHVFLEGNLAANAVASLGHALSLGCHYFNSVPLSIQEIIREDWEGVGFCRGNG